MDDWQWRLSYGRELVQRAMMKMPPPPHFTEWVAHHTAKKQYSENMDKK